MGEEKRDKEDVFTVNSHQSPVNSQQSPVTSQQSTVNSQQLLMNEEVFVFPASFAQQRLWFIEQLIPNNALYNVATALRLKGVLNKAALEQTFNEIVRRHETLRTTFATLEGELMQIVTPSLSVSIPFIDLQALPIAPREAKALDILTKESLRPFNLASEPLWRSLLLQLAPHEHILLLNLHHIVCDDWSIGILIKELGTLYTAFCRDITSGISILPELPLQYADYAEWQRQWLENTDKDGNSPLKNLLTYWQEKLNNISILNLPTDRPKPAFATYRGETQYLEISQQLRDGLATIAQQEGATLFMTLLAVFQILLYRYSHQEDIAVGSPIANRNRSEIEGLIGFFVNTLVLRTDLSGNPTFREVLTRVKQTTIGAYAHQDLPFEKLVEELQPERNLNHHPLFQVVFGFENTPMSALELPELEVTSIHIENQTTRFDLEFHLWECNNNFRNLWAGDSWQYSDGVRGLVVYNTDLFDAATITRMLAHFQTLIAAIIANLEQRIADLSMLKASEQYQLLTGWNHTQTDYPKNNCIHQLFEQQVEYKPEAIAYIETLPSHREITYKELNIRSNQLAHYLQKLGVGVEVIVGICIEPSIEMIVGLLAILKAGGTYLPLDPSYPRDRLYFMLEDAQVNVLLTQEKLLTAFTHQDDKNVDLITVCLDTNWEDIAQEKSYNLTCDTTAENLAYIIYTSGSTGKPKGVAVPHKAVNRLVRNTNYIKLESTDRIAQVSNISFDAATFEIWGALLNGAQLVSMSRDVILSPEELAVQLHQKAISVLFLTTALFQQVARDIPHAFASLRYLLFGGETLDSRWVHKVIKNNPPQNLIHVYGPTEGTTFSSYYLVPQQIETEELEYIQSIIPIGCPIANTQIYILDSNLQPLPIGVSGEIYIGGEGLARGYLNRPDLTAEKFIPLSVNSQQSPVISHQSTIYKTGDLGRYLPDGNIQFLGRIDNQVKIRGFRIELGEIEAVLRQHPMVKDAVAIATEYIPNDKRLVAYIVPEFKYNNSTLQELREFLKQKLPEYMLPAAFVTLESIPLTPNGKVDKKTLPLPDIFSTELSENYLAPRTSAEELLVEIWTRVLGHKQIGVYDNFFELGGHSLLATQLTSRIRDAFQIDLSVRQLFATPTIASLANYIETITWVKKGSFSDHSTINEREQIDF